MSQAGARVPELGGARMGVRAGEEENSYKEFLLLRWGVLDRGGCVRARSLFIFGVRVIQLFGTRVVHIRGSWTRCCE